MLVGIVSTTFVTVSLLGAIPSYAASNISLNDQSSKALVVNTVVESEVSKNKKILEKYRNATSLTDSQLVELLNAVGFKGKALKTAWAVAKAESNGRPFAFNGNANTGDSSYGIFQINMLGNLGPDRRDKFDLTLNVELFSPVTSAEIVFYMTNGGTDWSSWSTYKRGAVNKWLNKFPS